MESYHKFPGRAGGRGAVDGPSADELLLAVEGEGAAPTSTPPVVATILLLRLVLPRGFPPPVVLLRGGSPPLLSSPKALLSYGALAIVVVASGVSLFTVHVLRPERLHLKQEIVHRTHTGPCTRDC